MKKLILFISCIFINCSIYATSVDLGGDGRTRTGEEQTWSADQTFTGHVITSTFTVLDGSATFSGGTALFNNTDTYQILVQPKDVGAQNGQIGVRSRDNANATLAFQSSAGGGRLSIYTTSADSFFYSFLQNIKFYVGGLRRAQWGRIAPSYEPVFRFGDATAPTDGDATMHVVSPTAGPGFWVDSPANTHVFEVNRASAAFVVPVTMALPNDAAPRTNLTASTTYQLIINTGATPDEVCIATGTTAANQWVLIEDMSAACSN